MIICEKHGRTPMMLSCCHIGVAVDERVQRDAFVVIDGLDPTALCDACYPRALAIFERPTAGLDEERPEFDFGDGPIEPICNRCLGEWFDATQTSSLSAAVLAAHERAGTTKYLGADAEPTA